jgi:hypothetical protein
LKSDGKLLNPSNSQWTTDIIIMQNDYYYLLIL